MSQEKTNPAVQKLKAYWENLQDRYSRFNTQYPKLSLSAKIVAGLAAVSFLFLFVVIVLVYTGALGSLPTYGDLKNIRNDNASEVYAEGDVLLGKYYVENRLSADFEEISPHVINALVATEDARFFDHRGVDARALMRVVFKSILLSNESSGGGSTLSQQLAKNLYPRENYRLFSMLINKIREMFIARRLENIYTKEDLLRLYLNTVPFSENIFGIKVAARRFFNKLPEELKVEEAAVLIGMLKGTTYYNPRHHAERALQRRNTVISQMQRYGYLSEMEKDSLHALELKLDYHEEGNNRGLATYFREHLRLEMEKVLADYKKEDGSSYNLYTDGLKIHTSIDVTMQRYAEDAVSEHMKKLQQQFYKDWKTGLPWGSTKVLVKAKEQTARYKSLKAKGLSPEQIEEAFNMPRPMTVFSWKSGEEEKEMSPIDSLKYYLTLLNAGFLAMEPETGLVKAWVGGIDHKYFQYDHVKAKRQVGSTFKPIVYAAALQSGMMPCEYTENNLVTYVDYDNWQPRNSDGEYGGVYSMEGGLSHSVNSVTVEVLMRAGVDTVQQLAQQMGINSEIPAVPAISLGAVDASLADMLRVYGTFANRGRRPVLHYLDRIEDRNGKVLVEFDRPDPELFERVLSEDHSDMIIKMMESVVDSGTAKRLRYEYALYNDIAGKTGTTQNHSDGWFIGFTPNIVAGVWVGAELPQVHFRSMTYGQGANAALPIWGGFMKRLYKNNNYKKLKKAQFAAPADSVLAMMQCPPYLEEMPYWDEFWDEYLQPNFWDRIFGKKKIDGEGMEIYEFEDGEYKIYLRNKQNQLDSIRIAREIEKQKKRDVRREKRKEFWSEKLFKKKKG